MKKVGYPEIGVRFRSACENGFQQISGFLAKEQNPEIRIYCKRAIILEIAISRFLGFAKKREISTVLGEAKLAPPKEEAPGPSKPTSPTGKPSKLGSKGGYRGFEGFLRRAPPPGQI